MLPHLGEVIALRSHEPHRIVGHLARPLLIRRRHEIVTDAGVFPVGIVQRRIEDGRGILDQLIGRLGMAVRVGEAGRDVARAVFLPVAMAPSPICDIAR